jgi:tyrosyl-tRNA synthetase
MSKSLGNYIGVDESPNEIYGKVMALADNMIIQYFDLLTDVSDKELADFKRQLVNNEINPMNLKKRLAVELVTQLHNKEEAGKADEHFTNVFQKREMPEEITETLEFVFPSGLDLHKANIIHKLVERGAIKSISEGRRLFETGSVKLDGQKETNFVITINDGSILQIGKHRFFKIVKIIKDEK